MLEHLKVIIPSGLVGGPGLVLSSVRVSAPSHVTCVIELYQYILKISTLNFQKGVFLARLAREGKSRAMEWTGGSSCRNDHMHKNPAQNQSPSRSKRMSKWQLFSVSACTCSQL